MRDSYLHYKGLLLSAHWNHPEQDRKVAGFPAEPGEPRSPPARRSSASSAASSSSSRHGCVPEISPSTSSASLRRFPGSCSAPHGRKRFFSSGFIPAPGSGSSLFLLRGWWWVDALHRFTNSCTTRAAGKHWCRFVALGTREQEEDEEEEGGGCCCRSAS